MRYFPDTFNEQKENPMSAQPEPAAEEWLHYGAIGKLYDYGWDGTWYDCDIARIDNITMIKVGADAVKLYHDGEAGLIPIRTLDIPGDSDGHDQND
jgi:hypothetical protein